MEEETIRANRPEDRPSARTAQGCTVAQGAVRVIKALPAGWHIDIKDQGPQINEVWLEFHHLGQGIQTTMVVRRDTDKGKTLLEVAHDANIKTRR